MRWIYLPSFALRCAALIILSLLIPPCLAHGGVSVEDDTCIITIGPYKAHFTGYQPAVRASQEFCEDIPVVASSIIVVDFISQGLRDMTVDFRIVRDVNDIGVNAVYDDLGGPAAIERSSIFYRQAEQFPRGSFDVSIGFEEPGAYIGILTAIDNKAADAREYVSVFPFSVGVTNWWARLKWIILCLVLGAVLFIWSSRSANPTLKGS